MSPPNSSSLQHNKRQKLSTANSADASEDDSANVPSAKDSIGDDDSDNNNLNNAATATSLDLPHSMWLLFLKVHQKKQFEDPQNARWSTLRNLISNQVRS